MSGHDFLWVMHDWDREETKTRESPWSMSTLCWRCRRLCFGLRWFTAHPSVAPCFSDLSAPLTWKMNNNISVLDRRGILYRYRYRLLSRLINFSINIEKNLIFLKLLVSFNQQPKKQTMKFNFQSHKHKEKQQILTTNYIITYEDTTIKADLLT